jgi:hypothetical protein
LYLSGAGVNELAATDHHNLACVRLLSDGGLSNGRKNTNR